jgi:hypothetical protein
MIAFSRHGLAARSAEKKLSDTELHVANASRFD